MLSKHTRIVGIALISVMLMEGMPTPRAVASSLGPTALVVTEAFLVIDDKDTASDLQLQFGDTLREKLTYDRANARFRFSRSLFIAGNLTTTGAAIVNVGNTAATPDAGVALEVVGTMSGQSLTVSGLKNCNTIDTNGNGVLVCGTDEGGGGGISQADADARYVNQSGDTMTGALKVRANMSGTTLRVDKNADIWGTLSATGAIKTKTGAVLNADNDTNDAALEFGNATAKQSLKFVNALQRFEFSKSLRVLGTLSGTTIYSAQSVTGSFLHATTTFGGAGLTDCSGETQTLNWSATTKQFTCLADEGGGGGGITQAAADARYVNQSGDTMTGGLVVNASTNNLVKTTTGTTNSSDFSLAGSTLTNVTSQSDTITINEGTIPASGAGTMATSTIVTAAAAGAGSHTIIREDGQYIIVHGNSTATCSRWDGSSTTMTSVTCATGAVNPGAGSISLKRPDRRYLIVHGNASAGLTTLFDPLGITANAAGPAVCGAGAATTGTNAFLRQDGKYVILCGNLTAWGVYDPTANTYTAGTAVGTAFGAGAHAIMRDDGTFLVFRGANTTNHWIYNPFASTTGTMTADPITLTPPTITTGAFSIRRKDGKFLVMGGAVNTSSIYDPTRTSVNSGAGSMTAQSGVGFGPTVALADGAQAIWRQDGKYLLIIGAASTVSNIVDPSQSGSSQFTAGPALPAAPGAGVHLIMRPNGQYQIIRGGATTTTDNYDIGYIIGGNTSGAQLASYETECMTATSLNASSRLFWTMNQEGMMWFQTKTGNGACSGSYKDILTSSDLIRPTSGDNRIQVKVFFKRQFPNFADQEWKLRRGLGQTIYRQVNPDPTLYDFTVDNSSLVHRTQFEFGNSTDPSGPIGVNIINDRDKQLAISLAAGVGYGSTINASNAQFYNGAWGTHTVLTTTASDGTIVMRRPDGKFIVISGNTTTANAQVYDPVAQTFTALGTTPTAGTGLGARVFKRPDGKFLVVIGNATTTTNIFDPIANTFTAGPALTAAAGRGAVFIPLPNGRLLIMHGNLTATSSIYDPYQNTMVAGPTASIGVGGGSMAIPRPDGTYLFIPGQTVACTVNTTTNDFNPYTMAFVATGSPAGTIAGTGNGAFAFQRSDGQWLIVKGGVGTSCAGANSTMLYNPFSNKIVAGPTTSGLVLNGAHALPRPDGSWLIVHGGALTTTSIYLERAGAFTSDAAGQVGAGLAATTMLAGPALITAASVGSTSFQRDDGKFVTIIGNATTTTHQYDAGWVDRGLYKSEQMSVPDLDSTSALTWKGSPDMTGISAEVRTATTQQALQTAVSRDVQYSGAPINAAAGETWIRVHFNFRRTFPSYSGIFTDVWYNGGSPNLFTQRTIPTPTLTEFFINRDKDLVSLRSNARPVFRVNSNGDIFTGPQSSILTYGADVAERYASTQDLKDGELVVVDSGSSDGGIIRSSMSYQPDVLGIVSTNPGVVTGANTGKSYPIALIGRVPVKVSTENGTIHVGDRLAASSIPGHAMKATQAARVVGMALENPDPETLKPCAGNAKFQCGMVTMFVDLSDWPGPK